MKKSDFRTKSNIMCAVAGCAKMIKANVAERKTRSTVLFCFHHHKEHEATRGHRIKDISRDQFAKHKAGGNVGSLPAR